MSESLTAWTLRLLLLSAATSTLGLGFQVVTIHRFDQWWDATRDNEVSRLDSLTDWSAVMNLLAYAQTVVWVVAFASAVYWTNQAHKATARLNPAPRRWGSGWTVGGWLIPIANLAIPKMVLNEMERLTRSVRDPEAAGANWRTLSTMPVGWVWWLGGLLSLAIAVPAVALEVDEITRDIDATAHRLAYISGSIGLGVEAVATIAGVLYIRALSRSINGDC